MKKYLIALVILIFSVNSYAATTYYVATNGNDTTGDGTSGTPWGTIQHCVDVPLVAGDTCIVKNGTYLKTTNTTIRSNGVYNTDEEKFVNIVNRNGSAGNWITIKAQNKGQAIIDGGSNTNACRPFHSNDGVTCNGTTSSCDCVAYGFFIGSDSSFIKIQDFKITGIQGNAIFTNGSLLAQAHDLVISGNEIYEIGRVIRTQDPALGSSYNVGGGHTAMYIDEVFNVTVDSNIIHLIGRLDSGNNTNDYNKDHAIYMGAGDSTTADYGTHTGSNNAATLTDSTKSATWTLNTLHGYISNITDGSTCKVTANTTTTVTCTLSGGTDNDWDSGDRYSLSPFYNIDIMNNVFYNNTAGYNIEFGGTVYSDVRNVNILNNTIDGHPGITSGGTVRHGGIHLGYNTGEQDATIPPTLDLTSTTSTSGLLIANNIFYNPGTYAIDNQYSSDASYLDGYGDGYVYNNLRYNSTASQPNILNKTLGSCPCLAYNNPPHSPVTCTRSDYSNCGLDNWTTNNNITGNPSFTNLSVTPPDYTITGGVAIDAGIDYSGRTVDANGVAINVHQDIGAYELGADAINAPTSPSAADVPNDQGGSINLSWTPSSTSGVTEQRIYQATVSGGPYDQIATYPNNTQATHPVSGLTNGTTYYFVLKAYESGNLSAYSNEVNAVPVIDITPGTPTVRSQVSRTQAVRSQVSRTP